MENLINANCDASFLTDLYTVRQLCQFTGCVCELEFNRSLWRSTLGSYRAVPSSLFAITTVNGKMAAYTSGACVC